MKITRLLCLAIALSCGSASADEKSVDPAPMKTMKAEYSIYSGEIGDERDQQPLIASCPSRLAVSRQRTFSIRSILTRK
jgi:hypothetical protein